MKRALIGEDADGNPVELFKSNETELTLSLHCNGAVLSFRSADKPDSLYGEDVHALVVDEASRCKAETEAAIFSVTTATKGPIRIIGNVKGRRNWAYKIARRAEAQTRARERGEAIDPREPSMHFAKLTALDAVEAGVLDAEIVEAARAMLPDSVFQELYMAIASEDGSNPFGAAAIKAVTRRDLPTGERAFSNADPIVWGWDLARGLKREGGEEAMMAAAKKRGKKTDEREDRDWTVGIALDSEGQVCRYLRFQLPWPETKARILRETGDVPALVDSTGVGDPVLADLQRGNARMGEVVDGSYDFSGYHFSLQSKQALMEELSIAIQTAAIGIPSGDADGSPQIVAELETFEFEHVLRGIRYSAPPGFHDDCVCALALAVHHYNDPSRAWVPLVGVPT
jgi:hypothetical protein